MQSLIYTYYQLAKSISEVKDLQLEQGRDFTEITRKKIEKPRNITLRSTHKLSELTGSAANEVSHMQNIHHLLLSERAKQRDAIAIERAQSIRVADKPVLDPLQSAHKKLSRIAVKYDSRRMNNDLAGFIYGYELTYAEFDTQLRRCLNINLTKAELDAIFREMDSDGNMHIDGIEFTRYFFYLGLVENF